MCVPKVLFCHCGPGACGWCAVVKEEVHEAMLRVTRVNVDLKAFGPTSIVFLPVRVLTAL